MQQTDCNGILPCSDPEQHTPVWSEGQSDRVSAQRLESVRPCEPDPLPKSSGTGVDGRYLRRRGGRDP